MSENGNVFQDRIIQYGKKPADQFLFNPANARKHPQKQREAVRGSLNELGWVAPVIENVRTGHLIDGHERIWHALQNNNADVPFVQVDIDEGEEKLFLASFDYITQMAYYDAEILDELLQDVNTGDAALQEMLSELAEDAGIAPPDFEPVPMEEQPRLDQKKPVTCPHCGEDFVPDG